MDEATIRRLAALVLAPVFVVVTKKWGVDISEVTINCIVGLFAVYIATSNWKQAAVAKAEAQAASKAPQGVDPGAAVL